MVFLLTDVGEYRKLPVDRPVSIGRDTTSDIRPDSKSVSKSHAIITVSQIPNTKKFEAYIEDLNSRNGTFVGNSPLDFEKVTGKTKILFGDYIRFGNSSKFFKYLESIPAHENIPPELILSPTKDEKLDLSNLIADTAIYDSKDDDGSEVSKSNRKLEIADEQELKEGGDQSKARIHQLPERRKANSDSNNDPQNLMISVNYPTSGRSLRHPVTVTIDPVIQNQQSNYNSNNFDYSDDFDVDIDSSRTKYTKPKSKKEEVDYLSSSSPAALGTQDRVRFDESNEYYPRLKDEYGVEMRDVESATKPGPNSGILRNSAEVTVNPSENKLRGNNTKNIQQGPPRNSKIKDRDNNSIPRKDLSEPVQILRSPKVDTSKSRYDNSKVEDSLGRIETLMNLSAVPIVRNEVPLIRRSWPSELVKPSSRLICDFVDILLDQDVGVTIARLETGTIFKRDAIACAMPKPIPESIVSEVIANSLTEEEDSYNSLLNRVVVDINELLRQTLQGSKINSSVETSAEFDHALHGVVEGIIRNCLSSINFIIGSNLVKSMDDASAEPIGNSLGSLLRNSSEALKRINLFLTGGLLADDSQNLRTEEIYEVVSHCLSGILDRLDACNLAVWEVLQHVNEQTQKHVASNLHDPSEMNKSMLSIELEELRKLKKSLELAPSIERIRQQEAALLEKKMLRFIRVFDIALGHQLRSALLKWKYTVRAIVRQERDLQYFKEKSFTKVVKEFWRKWRQEWKKSKNYRLALHRFARIMCSKGESQLRKSFRQWELVRRQAKSSINTNEEIVKLKLELCNMKAQLEEISRRDQNAGYLVAERALNRELSRTNLELRKYIQELDEKMLELVSAPLLKKRELIHQFLMEKDDEIIELRKENDFLKASIENKEVSNDTTKKEKVYPSKGKFRSLPFDINGRENGSHFSDKAISTDASIPISSRMNKDAARKIILLEIRRLQDSHAHAAKANNLLLEELNAEKTDNIEKALVIHTLEKRFQALQRSSVSLRELLRQREGDKGILNLIDSLNAVGAGGAALQDYWNSNNVGNPSPNQEPQYDDHTEYLSNMNTNSVMPSKNREKEPTNYSKAVDDLLYSVKR